jgi:hypothetical protein
MFIVILHIRRSLLGVRDIVVSFQAGADEMFGRASESKQSSGRAWPRRPIEPAFGVVIDDGTGRSCVMACGSPGGRITSGGDSPAQYGA